MACNSKVGLSSESGETGVWAKALRHTTGLFGNSHPTPGVTGNQRHLAEENSPHTSTFRALFHKPFSFLYKSCSPQKFRIYATIEMRN